LTPPAFLRGNTEFFEAPFPFARSSMASTYNDEVEWFLKKRSILDLKRKRFEANNV